MAESNELEKLDKIQVLSQIKRMNKKYGKVATLEIKQRDPFIPPSVEAKIREEIKKMPVVTPNEIAGKYDIRVSSAKKLLDTMLEEGIMELVSSTSRLRIYRSA